MVTQVGSREFATLTVGVYSLNTFGIVPIKNYKFPEWWECDYSRNHSPCGTVRFHRIVRVRVDLEPWWAGITGQVD